jgi:hypothetical protein
MELGHLLTRSRLTHPEVSSKVCQMGNSVSLPWVIYYGAFYLHVVSISLIIIIIIIIINKITSCKKYKNWLTPTDFFLRKLSYAVLFDCTPPGCS